MIRILQETRLHPEFPLSRAELRPLILEILSEFGLEEASLTLRLVDDAEIARLNSTFLGCFGPTNVLSFPAAEADEDDPSGLPVLVDPEDGHLGEIALSLDTLERETRLYGQPPREHLVRLLVHSILHLAGLDHGPEMDAMSEAAMDALV